MAVRRLLLLLPLLAPSLSRAGNLDQLFVDDQAAMSGGAVIAAGSEPGSAWYNPAGLAHVERPTLDLDASAYAARFYHVPKMVTVSLPDGEGSVPIDTRSFFSTPSSLVYAANLSPGLSAALGIFTHNQLDVAASNSQVFHGSIPSSGEAYTYEQGVELDFRDKSYAFGPALGLAPAPWLRLGLGAYGSYQRQEQAIRFWGDYVKDASYNAYGFYDYALASRTDQRVGVSAYGLEGNAGAQVDLPLGLTLGLAFHSPNFLVYTDTDADIVLDGDATTQVANAPQGIVLKVHAKFGMIDHPYHWNGPYRAYAGLSKALGRGFVALECDMSDLPAESGKGALFNYRLGFESELGEHFSFGGGVYTDLRPVGSQIRQFGDSAVDYYGATLGIRHIRDYVSRRGDAPATQALKRMLMTTTLSISYNHGSGSYGGVLTDPVKIQFPWPVNEAGFVYDEVSAHLGGGFAF